MRHLFLLVLLLCASCSRQREASRTLAHARNLMFEQPSAALEVLRTVRSEKLTDALRADYALLYSQALDKNQIFSTDDSLIRIAVRYYRSEGTSHEKASSCYYLGRIHANRKDVIGAAEAFFRAEAYAAETDDYYLKGLIYNGIGTLHYQQYGFGEALACFRRSEECFRCAGGLTRNRAIATEALGNTYLNLSDLNRADSCYHEAIRLYEESSSREDVLRVKDRFAWVLYHQVSTDSVRRYLESLRIEYAPDYHPAGNWGLALALYYNERNIDSARAYGLKCIGASDRSPGYAVADSYSILEEIEFLAGNYRLAHEYANRYAVIVDSLTTLRLQTHMQGIEQRCRNELLAESNEFLAVRQHYQSIVIVLLSIIFILCVCIAFWAFRQWKRSAQAKIRQAETELEILRTTYDGLQQRMTSLQEQSDRDDLKEVQLYKALEERMIGLRDLIATSQTIKPSQFIKNFQKYAGINVNSRHALSDLQFVVNRKYNGVVDYLKTHYPDLTKHDLDLCCLLCFGFSQQAICYMYGYGDIGSFYNKRSRLRHKLHLSPDCKTEDFFRELLQRLSSQTETP